MKQCSRTIRRIHEAAGEFDRETLAHCLDCASCRRELRAVVAAASPEAPEVPERLEQLTLAACRNGGKRRLRYRVERALAWSGAAAVLCLVAVNLRFSAPAAAVAPRAPEWDAASLFGELSDIGREISRTQKLFAAEGVHGDTDGSI